MYQEQYWNEMVEIRAHQNYLMLYQLSSERWDLGFRAFLAIASSGAIGAWAVWQQYPKVWAGIIATSQVISGHGLYPRVHWPGCPAMPVFGADAPGC
jgi:hypothetical protein